ncbi:MAG: cotH [Planctomycetota bacterium]|nr:cotH [Planctomycetota bacterium]
MSSTSLAALFASVLTPFAIAVAQGPGGPPGGGPGGFGPGTFFAPAILKAADADKDGKLSPKEAGEFAAKLVREADTKKAGAIDAPALGRAINKMMPRPDFLGDDAPPAEDFGPGTFLGPQILEAADTNKDGKLSPEEAAKSAETFVTEADTDKTGSLTADSLGASINRRMGPPGGGPGGPMGRMGQERKLVAEFDKDGNGLLNAAERKAARASLKKGPGGGPPGGRRFGPPPGMFGGGDEPGKPGPKVDKGSVASVTGKALYDPTVLRTVFLDFEGSDWEAEMAEFNDTDVDLPATLTVDGKKYPNVGVHFRGLSSFMMVKEGSKRSLNVALDYADSKQSINGYKTLNLLNAHEDSTFLHTILYFHIARNYLPAPKANFVRVVINGESWGVYVNTQQFDKKFLTENYATSGGTRFKVPGNPGARGGLEYTGEDIATYKQRFQMKGTDDPKAWKALIALCRTLNETPPESLEAALKPMLDIDGVLWFLALDNALINNDGYWVRSSDYSIFLDPKGVFHILPHDANETFGPAMMMGPGFGGPGGRGGPGGPGRPPGGPGRPGNAGFDLDPLIGLNDSAKPLRSKLLAVPALRARYLDHVRTIARDWLDWEKLGPIVAQYRAVLDKELEADTRKLMTHDAYLRSVGEEVKGDAPRGRATANLRKFAEGRRKYLLENPEIKKLAGESR